MPSITINFSAAVATRIGKAMQEVLVLDAPATQDEVKAFLVDHLKLSVSQGETSILRKADRNVTPVTLT